MKRNKKSLIQILLFLISLGVGFAARYSNGSGNGTGWLSGDGYGYSDGSGKEPESVHDAWNEAQNHTEYNNSQQEEYHGPTAEEIAAMEEEQKKAAEEAQKKEEEQKQIVKGSGGVNTTQQTPAEEGHLSVNDSEESNAAAQKALAEMRKKQAEEAAERARQEAERLEKEAAEKMAAEEAAKIKAMEERAKEAQDSAAEAGKKLSQVSDAISKKQNEIAEIDKKINQIINEKIQQQKEKETKRIEEVINKDVSELIEFVTSEDKIDASYNDYLQTLEEKQNDSIEVTGETVEWLLVQKEDLLRQELELKEKEKREHEKLVNELRDMESAYTLLANAYEDFAQTGDPVEMSSGRFLASYDDFVAEDYLKRFTVTRKLTDLPAGESFGKNWSCPFDSRIIHSRRLSAQDYIQQYQLVKNDFLECIQACDNYIEEFDDYPREEIENSKSKYEYGVKMLDVYIQVLQQNENELKKSDELNQFVTYGRYADPMNYYSYCDMLIYVDDNGKEYRFVNEGNNKWKVGGGLYDSKMEIIQQKDGSFVLSYENGVKRLYSKYGVLEKEVDRNGNAVVYEALNGRICGVTLKTGEKLKIERENNGSIRKIFGPVSGEVVYVYENGFIQKVTDNHGISVSYVYDSDGFLKQIIKADGGRVIISYENESWKGKKVCAGVTNENGYTENFTYDFKNHCATHKNFSGLSENYTFSEDGFTTSHTDVFGNKTLLTNGQYGLIESVSKNGLKRTFTYDEKLNPVRVSFSDGSYESMSYNDFGQLVMMTDRDGFSTRYEYDDAGNVVCVYFCGNLITTVGYYPNGLMKNLTEKGITYCYEYNSFGNVTKKEWIDSYGKACSESWSYDGQNRVIKHVKVNGEVSEFSYSDLVKTEVCGSNKQIVTKYNLRGWVCERTEKDLKTGDCYTLSYSYDYCGNVLSVYLNGKEYVHYAYNRFGKMTECTVLIPGPVQKNVYSYDDFGYVTGVSVGNVQKYSYRYSRGSDKTVVFVVCGGNEVCSYTYDAFGRLTKESKLDGFTKNYSYSKAGRLMTTADSNGNVYTVKYLTDGAKNVVWKNGEGKTTTLSYNSDEEIVLVKDVLGNTYEYGYDSYGRQIFEKGVSYSKQYKWDNSGRLISEVLTDRNGDNEFEKKYLYEDAERKRSDYEGENLCRELYFDAWNRIVRTNGADGVKTYEYDWFGNCTSVTDSLGNVTLYTYDAGGNVITETDKENGCEKVYEYNDAGKLIGIIEENRKIYGAEFDSSGRLLKTVDKFGNENIRSYDRSGFVKSVERYDTGKSDYIVSSDRTKLVQKDVLGNEITYEVGFGGKVLKETDSLGNYKNYAYDELGRLKELTSVSGYSERRSYNDKENSMQIIYGNGEEVSVRWNVRGDVVRLVSDDSNFAFSYDENGRLTKSFDCLYGIGVAYEYDNFGRCTEKKSASFDYKYEYGKNGFVEKILDVVSGAWIEFEYDISGKVTKEKYSNGMVNQISYADNGQKKNVVLKNKSGETVHEESLKYDENGRICFVQNEMKEAWEYLYDSEGRLVEVRSPYKESIKEIARNEAVECGIGIKNENPVGVYLKIENGVQYSWFERYEYSKKGSLVKVTNPFGSIVYEYDKMGRISAKHGTNTNDGMFFYWDKDNCLVKAESRIRCVKFEYGAFLRPVCIRVNDYVAGKEDVYRYEYDSLGRRIAEIYNGEKIIYVYDVLSNEILMTTQVTENGRVLIKESGSENLGTEEYDFKWFGNDAFVSEDNSRRTRGIEDSVNESDGDSFIVDRRPCATLYCFGFPFVKSYVDGRNPNGRDNEFMYKDWRGSIIMTFNRVGECISECQYDTWGNQIQEGKNSSFCYAIGTERGGLQLMNLGERDYIPALKTFTTMDKKRDGGNWFAYCACDPVNYVDVTGREKKSFTEKEKALYNVGIAKVGEFDKEEYHILGGSKYIVQNLDCADVSSLIDLVATEEAGGLITSEMQKNFVYDYNNKNLSKAKKDVNSRDYYTGDYEKNVRKTGDVNDINNPAIVTPGSVLVFADDPSTEKSESHTVTVIACDYDDNGNVIGVYYIEGHSNGKSTESGYMKMDLKGGYKDGIFSISNWAGIFLGVYEIEATDSTSPECCK